MLKSLLLTISFVMASATTVQVQNAIEVASEKSNMPYEVLCKIAWIESRFHPNIKSSVRNSTARGLFQITEDTEEAASKKFGIEGDIYDPYYNSELAGYLMEDNVKKLLKFYKKRNLLLSDYYLLHFFGISKTVKFIEAKGSALGVKIFSREARYNKGIFYYRSGKPRTITQIRRLFEYKMKKAKVL